MTSRIAQSVTLDLNDLGILVERIAVANHLTEGPGSLKVKTRAPLSQRYNISNDEAYDLLKENHQSKIRSNLGNPQVDHSLPATRLQWPYVSTQTMSWLLEVENVLTDTVQNETRKTRS